MLIYILVHYQVEWTAVLDGERSPGRLALLIHEFVVGNLFTVFVAGNVLYYLYLHCWLSSKCGTEVQATL